MEAPELARYRVGEIQVEERGLRYGDATPLPARSELAQRGAETGALVGRCKRLGIRPDFQLTLYDFVVPQAFASEGECGPSLCISVLLDGGGEGWLAGGEAAAQVAYRPDTLYLCLGTVAVRGGYRLPADTRFHLVDLRFGLEFLERLGVLPMLLGAGAGHPLHCASGPGVWIGSAPTPTPIRKAAAAILETGFTAADQDLEIEARALDILNEVLALLRRCAAGGPQARPAGRELRRLSEAQELLLSQPERPWTIALLSRRVGLNEKKLKAGFKACFGETVHACLQRSRLAAAQRLLAEGRSVTETALAVGFANPSHFAALFKRELGLPPSRYRAQAPLGGGATGLHR